MPPSRPRGLARRLRRSWIGMSAILLAVAALGLAGCGPGTARASVTTCGTSRTAANVPVRIKVIRGQVSCGAAMKVEHSYTRAVADGKAPGNGGGGPIEVRGWKCRGFPTPQVLKTGQASDCVRGTTTIVAILPPA